MTTAVQTVSCPNGCSVFDSATGFREYHIALESAPALSMNESLSDLEQRHRDACGEHELGPDTVVFTRFYLSDMDNQKQALMASRLYTQACSGAVSIIEQRSLSGGACAMLAWHLRSPDGAPLNRTTECAEGYSQMCAVTGAHYRIVRIAGLNSQQVFDSAMQTRRICADLHALLAKSHMTVAANLLRTWIYVRDIDNHYQGMVQARRRFFEQEGLFTGGRYPASTGIGGSGESPATLVTLDALAIDRLETEQIVRMEALANMPPTIRYGVTFERGLRIRYGDRSHVYLSGTASIGPDGSIMHLSNPRRQTERALANARALLATQQVDFSDLRYLLVYVRNPADTPFVMPVVREQVPAHVPVLALQAPVCRPGWLMEIEGEAVVADSNGFAPFS